MNKYFRTLFVAAVLLTTSLALGCNEDTEAKSTSTMTPVLAQDIKVQGKFPAFNAKDINGKPVTNEIFAQKELTVVNVWGTFCPPCIGEMPDLGKWAKAMPDNVQLVGIVCDVRGNDDSKTIDSAKQILNKAHAEFLNIVPDAALGNYLRNVDAVPTTIFVNNQGEIVGNPILGAEVEAYKNFVKAYLNAKN